MSDEFKTVSALVTIVTWVTLFSLSCWLHDRRKK